VQRYWHPEEFAAIREAGARLGFKHVEAGPFVRSSYHAGEQSRAAGAGAQAAHAPPGSRWPAGRFVQALPLVGEPALDPRDRAPDA
jgi:hypothetical protein